MEVMRRNPLNVVLIEDDEVDAEIVARCLDSLDIPHVLTVYSDGQEALTKLEQEKQQLGRAYPFFVLLDIQLPRMSGIELLEAMRSSSVLKAAIVFVLTSSDDLGDMLAAYDGRVAGYLVKETLGSNYERLAQLIRSYYQVVEFPVLQS